MPDDKAPVSGPDIKISAAMIVRDCEGSVGRTLASIRDVVDEIVVVDTGSVDGTKAICEKYADKLLDFKWVDDFAAARNFSFEHTTHDHVFWIDSDDELIGGKQVMGDAKLLIHAGVNVIQLRYDYEFNEAGQCTCRLIRERIVDKQMGEWRSPIHEVFCGNFKVLMAPLPNDLGYIKHHRKIKEHLEHSHTQRNLEILKIAEQKGRLDTRSLYYYANSLFGFNDWEGAAEKYARYVPRSGVPHERYAALVHQAMCLRMLGRLEEARGLVAQAQIMFPRLHSAYLEHAEIFLMENNFARAQEWAQEAILHQDALNEEMLYNPIYSLGRQHMIVAMAHGQRLDYRKAQDAVRKAETIYGCQPEIEDLKEKLQEREMRHIVLTSFDTLVRHLSIEEREEDISELAALAPKIIATSPSVQRLLPKQGDASKPTIAFFCPTAFEKWGPSSIKTGIGGSEEAVIHLSRELAKRGFNVHVYAHTEEIGLDQGVQWYSLFSYNPLRDKPDIVVSWRSPDAVLEAGLACKLLYLWQHDVPQTASFTRDFANYFKSVFVLSQYHRDLHDFIPDDLVTITKNGIDIPSLPAPYHGPRKNLIWTSCPTRGLVNILRWWTVIRDAAPETEIDIYYGWNPAVMLHKQQSQVVKQRFDEVESLKDQPGVNWKGRVGQDELHEAISKAAIWCYPTFFPEISCISAMKAQALGAMPIVANYAALKETVQWGVKLDGDFTKLPVQRTLIQIVIDHLLNPSLFPEDERERMMQWARATYSWASVADSWAAQFKADLSSLASGGSVQKEEMGRLLPQHLLSTK